MSFTIVQNEKTPFQAIKIRISNSRKIEIFPRGQSRVLVKNLPYFYLFILGNIGKKNVFYDSLERKNAFLGYKNKNYKKSKYDEIFPKGLIRQSMVLVKIGNFSIFLCYVIQARKISFSIVQSEKRPFQAMKTRRSKTRKFEIFPKGLVHGFGENLAIFPSFYFRQYSQEKCLLRQSSTRKRLSRL